MTISNEEIAGLSHRLPLHILVAEDNLVSQKLAASILAKLGYAPVFVKSGLEVITAFDTAWYNLIFLDLEMPEMGGIEAAKILLEKLRYSSGKPVIVALTSNMLESDRQRSMDAGINDYLIKPFRLEDIYSVILKWEPYLHPVVNP